MYPGPNDPRNPAVLPRFLHQRIRPGRPPLPQVGLGERIFLRTFIPAPVGIALESTGHCGSRAKSLRIPLPQPSSHPGPTATHIWESLRSRFCMFVLHGLRGRACKAQPVSHTRRPKRNAAETRAGTKAWRTRLPGDGRLSSLLDGIMFQHLLKVVLCRSSRMR